MFPHRYEALLVLASEGQSAPAGQVALQGYCKGGAPKVSPGKSESPAGLAAQRQG